MSRPKKVVAMGGTCDGASPAGRLTLRKGSTMKFTILELTSIYRGLRDALEVEPDGAYKRHLQSAFVKIKEMIHAVEVNLQHSEDVTSDVS